MTNIELLAPAKNLECGIAAIDAGADAVYKILNHQKDQFFARNNELTSSTVMSE
ncbi:MAG: hypothetical protein IJS60_09900 [Abditibacteriota bacterium]|nr:hypothetical protein [Abditibacteriota bacterium]